MRFPRLLPDDPEIGWMPYAWLIYLIPFVVYPALARVSAFHWVATVAGLAFFLAFYFWGLGLGGLKPLGAAAGFLLPGVFFPPANPGGAPLFCSPPPTLPKVGRP